MLAKLTTFALLGFEALPVPRYPRRFWWVDLNRQCEKVHMVWNEPWSTAASPGRSINLAPAELLKQAASFDLSISPWELVWKRNVLLRTARAISSCRGISSVGKCEAVKGSLSMAMSAASQAGLKGILVSNENASEAALVEDIEFIPVSSLTEAVNFFTGIDTIDAVP